MKPTLTIYAAIDINPDFAEYIHDHNLALFESGQIIKYLHLERLTRQKYDNSLHRRLYDTLKKEKLLTLETDLGFVDSILGRSFISTDGKFRFEADPWEKISTRPQKGRALWLTAEEKQAWGASHELAHIFSTVPFYGMFHDNSLLVHFDGGASKSNLSVWLWRSGKLELIDYSWEARHLSSLFNANALNFFITGVKRREHNSMAGKYMGLAGWGQYRPEIEQWLVENDFFADIWPDKKFFFRKAKERFGWQGKSFDSRDKFLQDIAATVQQYFTRETVKLIARFQKKFQANHLYYTGGSALNLYTNQALINSGLFDNVFIPPATGDSGLSLGAGAFIEWSKGNEVKKHLPYLNNWGLDCPQVIDDPHDIARIASLLMDDKVIGICNGWGEAGPRALGNRSIIALPHSRKLSRRVSEEMKGREWYRPVAPIMLASEAQKVTGIEHLPELARYMLINFKVLPQWRDRLRGIVHADGTARIQVLFRRGENPFMWDLLTLVRDKYGVPALINTSFNSRGKPIVHTPGDALTDAGAMGLDALVINGRLV